MRLRDLFSRKTRGAAADPQPPEEAGSQPPRELFVALSELALQPFDLTSTGLLFEPNVDASCVSLTEIVNQYSLRARYRLRALWEIPSLAQYPLDVLFCRASSMAYTEFARSLGASAEDIEDGVGMLDPELGDDTDPDEDFLAEYEADDADEDTPESELRADLSYYLQDFGYGPSDFDAIIAWDKAAVENWRAKYSALLA